MVKSRRPTPSFRTKLSLEKRERAADEEAPSTARDASKAAAASVPGAARIAGLMFLAAAMAVLVMDGASTAHSGADVAGVSRSLRTEGGAAAGEKKTAKKPNEGNDGKKPAAAAEGGDAKKDNKNGGGKEQKERRAAEAKAKAVQHKMGLDEPGTIWIVNQPKCGTGSLERSVMWGLDCDLIEGTRYKEHKDGLPKTDFKTRFFDCPKRNKKMFRTHTSEAGKVKAHVDDYLATQEGGKPDKCIVMTAVRDPLLSIPSLFFEQNKEKYCDGKQTKEEILTAYEKFLTKSPDVKKQAQTTAAMLRDFGVTDIRAAMNQLEDGGYAFFEQNDPDSPWAGCELLFLQIDYDEKNRNLDQGFDHVVAGLTMLPVPSRDELCPKAVDNYHALVNYEIKEEHIAKFSETHPEMRDVIGYYQKRRRLQRAKK